MTGCVDDGGGQGGRQGRVVRVGSLSHGDGGSSQSLICPDLPPRQGRLGVGAEV